MTRERTIFLAWMDAAVQARVIMETHTHSMGPVWEDDRCKSMLLSQDTCAFTLYVHVHLSNTSFETTGYRMLFIKNKYVDTNWDMSIADETMS